MKNVLWKKHPAITLRDVGRKARSQAFSIDMKNLLENPPPKRRAQVSVWVVLTPAIRGLFLSQTRRKGRVRTCDMRFWRPPLYRLSYLPVGKPPCFATWAAEKLYLKILIP